MEFRSCARVVSSVTSFITTDKELQLNRGCCFPKQKQAMLPGGFPFHQFNVYMSCDLCVCVFEAILSTFFLCREITDEIDD